MRNSFSDSSIQKNLVGNNAMEDLDVDQPELVVKKEQGDYSCSSTLLNQGCNEPSGRSLWRVSPPSRNSETCSLPKSVNECMPSTSSLVNVKEEIKVEYEFEGDSEMPCASKDSKDILGQSVLGSELLDSTESNGLDNNSSLVDISIKEEIKLENESEDVTVIPYSSQTSEDSKDILEHFIEGGVDILDTSGSKELDKHACRSNVGKRKKRDAKGNHPCPWCDYVAARKLALDNHVNSVHLKLRNHHCEMCEFSASSSNILRNHVVGVHLKIKNQKCHLCDFTTRRRSNLKNHIEGVHLKKKNFKCELCDYAGLTKLDVERHMNYHLRNENHQCHLCDFRTHLKCSLKRHLDNVHMLRNRIKCEKCSYRTDSEERLAAHVNKMHNDPEREKMKEISRELDKSLRYPCTFCSHVANRVGDLKKHIDNIHLKIKTQKCHSCDFSAFKRCSLLRHIQVVHILKSKGHQCNLCDHRTATKDSLQMHLDTVHLEEMSV